ncbi:hypothetical protein BC830DRAFT_1120934 [Chytriomyces sp. MP71]|nr:hypothetical protein BC830DRAFT_1120934 [Chytriomyces sp. MP71]
MRANTAGNEFWQKVRMLGEPQTVQNQECNKMPSDPELAGCILRKVLRNCASPESDGDVQYCSHRRRYIIPSYCHSNFANGYEEGIRVQTRTGIAATFTFIRFQLLEFFENRNARRTRMQSPPPLPSLALKPASKSLRRNPSHASSYSNASNSATNFGATSSSTLFAKALYDFPAHEPDELYFEEEDLIVIPARTGAGESSTSDWLYGENNGVFGWFPASYVRIVDKVEVEADLNLYCGAWRKVPPRTNLKGVTDSCDSMAVLRGSVDILQAPQSLDSLAGSNFDVSMTSIATQGADGSDSDDDRELSFKPSKSRYQLALRAALTDSPSTNTTQKNTIMHSLGQDDSTCGDSTPKRTPWLHKLRRNSSSFGSASKLKVGVTAPSEAETSSTQTLPQPTADTSDSASLISDASSVVSARAPALTKLAESNPTLSKPIPAPLAPALSNKTVAIMGAPQGLKKLWVESIGGTMALEALGISKMEKQRQEVIYEIVTTEKDYVADLEILLGVFLVRLREGRVVQSKDLGVLNYDFSRASRLFCNFSNLGTKGTLEKAGGTAGKPQKWCY